MYLRHPIGGIISAHSSYKVHERLSGHINTRSHVACSQCHTCISGGISLDMGHNPRTFCVQREQARFSSRFYTSVSHESLHAARLAYPDSSEGRIESCLAKHLHV